MTKMKLNLAAIVTFGAIAAFGRAVPIYPHNDGYALNLRVPTYAKPDIGAKGAANPFGSGAAFSYDLSQHLKFMPGDWRMDFYVRGLRQSIKREIFKIVGNAGHITFGNGSNRVGKNWPYLETQVPKGKVIGAFELPHEWMPASIVSTNGELIVTVGEKELLRTPANRGYIPKEFKVCVWYVDELVITGKNGRFTLDWENNTYAGQCDITSDGGVSVNVMGFDTMVISDDKFKRDCPVLSIANTSVESKTFNVRFDYHTEVTEEKVSWTQSVQVDAGSETLAFVDFPKGLHDDIYHMTIKCPDLNLDETKHFMYVKRRGEEKGDNKFGWHEVCNYLFGGYMDALPVTYAARYIYPHWVYDAEWLEDFRVASRQGDPKTLPEAYNWPSVAEWVRIEGRPLALCVHNFPNYDYSRDKEIPELCDQEWHKWFMRQCADRYRDNIVWWEVENEPNAHGKFFGKHPEYYVYACKSMKEVMSIETPKVPVYGISTQGNWIKWMDKALAAGAGKYLDGVSFHTYSGTPIEDTNMPEILRETHKRFPNKPMINTETGVSVVPREKIDEMLTPAYIENARARRAPGFNRAQGWCTPVDELTGAISMTRNVLVNFQQGVRIFTFFLPTFRNAKGAQKCGNWKERPHDFTSHGCTPEGEMSPNRLLLASGVLTCQLEPAILDGLRPINEVFGVNGVVFPKKTSGIVAAIWGIHGTVDIALRADVPEIECVGMQGERSVLKPLTKQDDVWLYQIALDMNTRYLHTKGKVFDAVPVPLTALYALQTTAESGEIVAEFENRLDTPQEVNFAPCENEVIPFTDGIQPFTLAPGEHREMRFGYRLTKAGEKVTVCFQGKVNKDTPLNGQVTIRALKGVSLTSNEPATLNMDRDDQVVLGHADDMTSLLEAAKFWAGRDDLSGKITLDWDDRAFIVKAEMTDKQFKLAPFPGVRGTSVELFCDFRKPGKGLGDSKYSDGCYQFLIEPTDATTTSVLRVYSPQLVLKGRKAPPLPKAEGIRTKEGYNLTVRIPWRIANKEGTPPETFGFDFGANCAFPDDKPGRRAQMMLFGTAGNASSASAFGRIRLIGERNNAIIPTAKLENDGYDWHARHAAIMRSKGVKASNPEIVLLGDSIFHRWVGGGTTAFGVSTNSPAIWKKWFDDCRTLNFGFGWDRTQNVLWRIQEGELDELNPKWLVIHIGSNNLATWGNARQNTGDEIGTAVKAIVSAAHEKLPETRILLVSILPRCNPYWLPWIDAANKSIEKQCAQVPYVTYLRLRKEYLNQDKTLRTELFQSDATHLSDAGYDILGQAIRNKMKEVAK